MARLAALCVLAAVGCLLNSMAFVPAPESQARAINTGAVAAAAGVMAAGTPQNAEAFVFKGGFGGITVVWHALVSLPLLLVEK